MCGIVGGIVDSNIVPTLLQGLLRLEYRGYDSCGLSISGESGLRRLRSISRVKDLAENARDLKSRSGLAHVRWASHGRPTIANAHPHFSPTAGEPLISVVHNGIIENYIELRARLIASGVSFASETDTEVIAHLVADLYRGDLLSAVREAIASMRGSFAIAVMSSRDPDRVVGARAGSPLLVGRAAGKSGYLVASDVLALAGVAGEAAYLEEGDVFAFSRDDVFILSAEGKAVERHWFAVSSSVSTPELGPFQHFMQKEIFEQPNALADTIDGVQADLVTAQRGEWDFGDVDSVLLLACGTSFHAAKIAAQWIETHCGIVANAEIASEYKYRVSVPGPNRLVVTVSQSGETIDTLTALRHAKRLGMTRSIAICNVGTSALVRESDRHLLTRAGLEVGVASTKAFTCQLAALFALTLAIGRAQGRLSEEMERDHLTQLQGLPDKVSAALALEPTIISWAQALQRREHVLFLGRGIHYAVAMEGALKMKEVSYIHADAYPAGELKHGPLALVTPEVPIVATAPNDELFEKLYSNLQEVRARRGFVYLLVDSDLSLESDDDLRILPVPLQRGPLAAILHTIPLQLLAYHIACLRQTDVDKPRNLAKSLTVE
ncbi:glutamine--fructose-6-phosphate transaminase (isomerizing) [Bradyrhizobium sp. 21]|uniref:glutamine--fructose-6-phosphate transaminase (isomerizing) n=1 Tax=Bradyrhizobium sp. 21 TaxID=2782666 RepID=UPI001FF93673|nr:glutamine--fructose-6-phosphate transaminase (isomerizing) [Bradyrhizobium sp. 21]MCK1387652.1 glutamine--fructose-6-phosphate transaminase (isomerizing) [Bradyrhizobium sp. 21]